MLSSPLISEFETTFPFIKQVADDFRRAFYEGVTYHELDPDTPICDEGQICSHLAMVLDGVGRVYKLSASGREVTLYRISSGQSCVLTASCIMNQDSFPAMAVAETRIRAILVPPSKVQEWFCQEPQWQVFIFGLLSHRLSDIITVVEEVAFKRIDVRIAEHLIRDINRQSHRMIHKTHAELAADVGSSREVISRILRDFSQRGLIQATRGSIEVVNLQALEEISKQ
jgi:CRP/FNR family transcriptional regulator